jgi:hypothetical protein
VRRLALLLVVALLGVSVPAQAAPTTHTHLGWTEGTFEAGLAGLGKRVFPAFVDAPDHERVPFPVDPCHRELSLGLDYEPRNASVRAAEAGYAAEASLPYRFQAGLVAPNGTVLHRITIEQPDLSIPFGTVEEPGEYELELELLEGALVDWSVRVRGFAVDDPACQVWLNEVETSPASGDDWVELYNEGPAPVDVTGWSLHANRSGQTTTLGEASLASGEHRVVDLGPEALADVDESVALQGPAGGTIEASGELTDEAGTDETWQKPGDGLGDWILDLGTPGEPNAE